MSDDWENEDWESKEFKPPVPAPSSSKAAADKTAGELLLAKLNEPDMSKFADEEQIAEEEQPKHSVPKPQPKKKEDKKYTKGEIDFDEPLDDPVAEKLRQQRLVEQSDFNATKDLFGGAKSKLDSMLPKTLKEFEDYANAIVSQYVAPHADSKQFKAFIKQLCKAAADHLKADEVKDVETSLAGLRSDKTKAEKAAKEAAAQASKKKSLNVGKSAGLDEFVYDDDVGDEYDFM